MRRRVYRSELDGPGVVALRERGDQVTVEYLGTAIQQVKVSEVRRGVAFPTGDGHELALFDGGRGSRITVKLDGERLTPTMTQFNWVGYAPHVLMATALVALTMAGLAYARIDWAWHLVIRPEALIVGVAFMTLYWTGWRFGIPVGAIVMTLDVFYAMLFGLWTPTTLLVRIVIAGYLARAAYDQWEALSE